MLRQRDYSFIACLALSLAGLLSGSNAALAARFALCGIGLRDFNMADQCLPPTKIAKAEREMPVTPVRPVAVVHRLTGLWLGELEVRNPGKPLEILYLFGRVPTGPDGKLDLSSHTSKYVIVGEVIGHSQLRTPRLFPYPAALGGTAYWQWDGNFPCRNLTLDIRANIQGSTVQHIGQALLRTPGCGK